MKSLILTALAVAIGTGAALAQAAPPPPPGGPAAGRPGTDAPPPPPPPGGPRGAMDGPPPPPGMRAPPPPPPPSRAAHFRVEQGDMKVDVKCAADEPMKACAELAMQLVDKVAAMRPPR